LAFLTNSRRRRIPADKRGRYQNRSFAPFFAVGTAGANVVASLPDGPVARSGRKTMTFNFANVQQFAISAIGALLAASLFISAAVGPAGQLI
jgi:hypothetical protein